MQSYQLYARRGWLVIPLHGIRDGQCTCQEWRDTNGKGPCPTPGKHPRIRSWQERATTDMAQIEQWFSHDFRGSNIGIATGADSGIFVLDVDPKNGGEESLESLIAKHGRLPDTIQAITGSGGRHFYFSHPGELVRNDVALLPGLDIRGDGGMVVAPPSMHISGRCYDWDGLDGFNAPILPAPKWLLNLIISKPRRENGRGNVAPIGPEIPEGKRNDTLTRLAGAVRRKGAPIEAINAYLQAENKARCKPPLPEDEVRQIAESVGSYEPSANVGAAPAEGAGRMNLIEYPFTDAGNAERLHALYGDRFRYSHPQRQFFVWDGQRWAPDSRGVMRHLAREMARELFNQSWDVKDADLQDQTIKHARKSEGSQGITNMLKEAGCIPGVAVLPDELDRDPFLLNVLNGTIDLRTGELRPHRREDLITRLAPVEYDPAARSPLWEQFLDEATGGDQQLQEFLQRAAGYSLTGDTGEEKLFFVHGPAAAGKSTFLEALKATLGDYAKSADFESFIQRRESGAVRNDIAELAGRRFVVSIEVDEGKKLAEGLVKTLTGGDTIRARFLYQEAFEFLPSFKLWLAANHAPRVKHDDSAMWRRILRIPFERVIPKERRDPSVKARLKDARESGPAILAWAVEGCLRWQEEGLGVPEIVEKATEQYRLEMDPLREFIADCCVLVPNAWTPAARLREAYEAYCKETGEKRLLNPNEFGAGLRGRGCDVERRGKGRTRGWRGIGLLADEEWANGTAD